MIKIENLSVYGFEEAIRGMRNPMNSWNKSDSGYCFNSIACHSCKENRNHCKNNMESNAYIVGNNDLELMQKLAKGGPVHAKYRRYIDVYVDITAPLYW